MPFVTVGAIIEKEGKILFLKRNHEPFKDCWGLPGGKVEDGETVEEAVIREIKEETNLDLTNPKFMFYHNEIYKDKGWFGIALFFTGNFSGEIKLSHEHTKYDWFTIEEIREMKIAFKNKEGIERYLEMK